jgi:hypothetical protein
MKDSAGVFRIVVSPLSGYCEATVERFVKLVCIFISLQLLYFDVLTDHNDFSLQICSHI